MISLARNKLGMRTLFMRIIVISQQEIVEIESSCSGSIHVLSRYIDKSEQEIEDYQNNKVEMLQLYMKFQMIIEKQLENDMGVF